MEFYEQLNAYMDILECTSKEFCAASGISEPSLSRYRSGERCPKKDSEIFEKICTAIAAIAKDKGNKEITVDSVRESFLKCALKKTDKRLFRQRFNSLFAVLDINFTRLCQYTSYDISSIVRFRNGSRSPADPSRFATGIASYVTQEKSSDEEIAIIAELMGCRTDALADRSLRAQRITDWLLSGEKPVENPISSFLTKLDEFNLNEYIKSIHFDELKVPSVPFQLPTSKSYFGLKEMMESELDFLKATVLSKSMEPVIMYSDMPMAEMSKDPEFPKKWMFGMAMMLKKGLHLTQIHNLDRSFEDMMLGLEGWIPMYMTGQISPYYLANTQNSIFLHFLKVSGTAALSGEAITDHHGDGKYYLTKSKDEVKYYRKRAEDLLGHAHPLMEIYREDNADTLNAFLLADSRTEGKRRSILSSLPLCTMDRTFLEQFLAKRNLTEKETAAVLSYYDAQRSNIERILKRDTVEDEIPFVSEEEFENYPLLLSLSGMFYEKEIAYTYEEYLAHLKQTEAFAESHPNYVLSKNASHAFRNLQIIMHEGEWAMVSKAKTPVIHFVIKHPKLRSAIESFIPPVVEEENS